MWKESHVLICPTFFLNSLYRTFKHLHSLQCHMTNICMYLPVSCLAEQSFHDKHCVLEWITCTLTCITSCCKLNVVSHKSNMQLYSCVRSGCNNISTIDVSISNLRMVVTFPWPLSGFPPTIMMPTVVKLKYSWVQQKTPWKWINK